ncbi:PTS sugar transporter subunit IIC, partial [Escherichia coli]|nr:PTS sugar transporter subunit IIC [Escherichia coli]
MHEITLLQGLSLAALVFVLGIDFWLEALFLFRPIIVCTLTGAILGDIQTGLITGGLTELAFAGLTPAGGVQPPNPIMAGLMTTVIALYGSTTYCNFYSHVKYSPLASSVRVIYVAFCCYTAPD